MGSIYYKIWANAIRIQMARKKNGTGWELFALVAMSLLQGLNLLVLLFILHWLFDRRVPVVLPSFLTNWRIFNVAIVLILTFFLPFVIINYLLIFYNKRYQQILQIYPHINSKLYRNYALISIGLIVVPIVFKILFL